MALQLQWLQSLLHTQPAAFEAVPEYVVSDGVAWLAFLMRAGAADLIATIDIGALCF